MASYLSYSMPGSSRSERAELHGPSVLIGEQVGNPVLVSTDGRQPPRRCRLSQQGDQWWIQCDGPLTNGILLNDQPLEGIQPLYHESVIKLGAQVMKFILSRVTTPVQMPPTSGVTPALPPPVRPPLQPPRVQPAVAPPQDQALELELERERQERGYAEDALRRLQQTLAAVQDESRRQDRAVELLRAEHRALEKRNREIDEDRAALGDKSKALDKELTACKERIEEQKSSLSSYKQENGALQKDLAEQREEVRRTKLREENLVERWNQLQKEADAAQQVKEKEQLRHQQIVVNLEQRVKDRDNELVTLKRERAHERAQQEKLKQGLDGLLAAQRKQLSEQETKLAGLRAELLAARQPGQPAGPLATAAPAGAGPFVDLPALLSALSDLHKDLLDAQYHLYNAQGRIGSLHPENPILPPPLAALRDLLDQSVRAMDHANRTVESEAIAVLLEPTRSHP